MCAYKQGARKSPDRMDALVWGVSEILKIGSASGTISGNKRGGIPGW
jgi:phage terminase large subunit-like protein